MDPNRESDPRDIIILEAEQAISDSFTKLKDMGVDPDFDVLSDQNIAEILTPRPSRMAFGVFTYIFSDNGAIKLGRNEMGYEIGEELHSGMFSYIGGQPRCSIIHDALTYRIEGIPFREYFNGFVRYYLEQIREDRSLANYPEVVLYEQDPSLNFLKQLYGERKAKDFKESYRKFFEKLRGLEARVADEFNNNFKESWRQLIRSRFKAVEQLDYRPREIHAEIKQILEDLRTQACIMFVKVARLGFFAYARVRNDLQEKFNESTANKYLEILTIPEKDASREFNIALSEMKNGSRSLEDIIEEYGFLGINELEIQNPRYHENPPLLEKQAKGITDEPAKQIQREIKRRENLEQQLVQQEDREWVESLREDARVARQYLGLREEAKQNFLMGYDVLRRALLKLEESLDFSEGEIFYLDPRELGEALNNPTETKQLLEVRQMKQEDFKGVYVPPVIFSDQLDVIGRNHLGDKSTGILEGIGVTSESTVGVARIVMSPEDTETIDKIEKGDILVAPTTDPSWGPIISSLGSEGGLVTEIGGPLAHGAIVARELGIAAVLNVANATEIISNGAKVKVDGKEGKVHLLDGD